MKKCALVLHGWPQKISDDHNLIKILKKHNYEVIKPYLFEKGFDLTLDNAIKFIDKNIGNKKLDLIIGASFSGFIAPYISQKHPQAKLILIVSAPKLMPRSKQFERLVKIVGSGRWGEGIIRILLIFSDKFGKWWYRQLTAGNTGNIDLDKDVNKSMKVMKMITPKNHWQTARIIYTLNNSKLLENLRNKTLIISGSEDILMPAEAGENLKNLIKNSKLVVTKASHYNALNRETYAEIEKFI